MKEDYSLFSERIYEKSFQNKIPSHGHFELTFQCPLKCIFCYCSCYTSPQIVKKELSTLEVKRILKEAADGGCLWITFSGGDPLVRKDFREIYDYARSLGMIISIFCSGMILTDEWLQHFIVHPPLKIEVPLYGISQETYEIISGKIGSFSRVLKNIHKMIEAGLPLKVKTKLTKYNFHEADQIQDFIERELGKDFHPNFYLYPRLNGDKEPLNYRLTPAQIKDGYRRFSIDSCDSNFSEEMNSDRLFQCAAGINSFYINPYGELNFCTYVRADSISLREHSIKGGVEILRNKLLTRTSNSACGSCKIKDSCENCPGHAYLETGSLEGVSEYLCEVNHHLRDQSI